MQFIDVHTHKEIIDTSVVAIKNKYPNNIRFEQPFSIGIHPWFIKKECVKKELLLIENQLQNEQCFALGECGLDTICATDFQLQKNVFKTQIRLSEKHQKPLLIHCVKAFQEIIALKKELKPLQTWILHGFNKNKQTAESLLKNGFLLSFGNSLLYKESLQEIIFNLPINKFFLETDDTSVTIQEIYLKVAEIKKIKTIDLQEKIYTNFNIIFKK